MSYLNKQTKKEKTVLKINEMHYVFGATFMDHNFIDFKNW